jgi:hypothetical protein
MRIRSLVEGTRRTRKLRRLWQGGRGPGFAALRRGRVLRVRRRFRYGATRGAEGVSAHSGNARSREYPWQWRRRQISVATLM